MDWLQHNIYVETILTLNFVLSLSNSCLVIISLSRLAFMQLANILID